MSDSALSFNQARGLAAARSAEAMLCALGGGEVKLRFATPADSTSTGDARLGLAETGSEDIVVSPVVVRSSSSSMAGATTEMLFAASSIAKQLELRGFDSGDSLFQAAIAIVHDSRTYQVESVSTDFFVGTPYLFRVTVSQ